MNLIGEAPEPKLVQDALTNEERLFLNTHCTIDHDPELCEYCQFRGGPCWNPHRPSDCPKCIGSDLGCCFNADLFLDQTVVVVPVDRTPKEKLKPYVFSSGPRVVETQISIRAL